MNSLNDSSSVVVRALANAVERRLLDVHTCLTGVVDTYYPETQTADIQLVVKRTKANDTLDKIEYPKLVNVPVRWPRTANGILHFPLAKDDHVTVIFQERNHDLWRFGGGIVAANDGRKHHLSDAIALAGAVIDSDSFDLDGEENHVALFHDGMKAVIEAELMRVGKVGSSQTEPVVLGAVLTSLLTNLIARVDSILDILIAGTHVLTTTPGNPTAPNPTAVTTLTTIKTNLATDKTTYIDTTSSNIVSQVFFTER